MADDSPLTYRDVATILALLDSPQRGSLTLTQEDMTIRVEKTAADASTATPPEDTQCH